MPVLLYVVPKSAVVPLVVICLVMNIFLMILWYKYLKFKGNLDSLFFTIAFFVLGLITVYVKGYHFTIAIIPIISFFAFCYISRIKYEFKVFSITLIGLYVFFFITYFVHLPALSIRVLPDQPFEMSSSNTIAISLNILLFIYIILLYYRNVRNDRQLIIYAIINFVLIALQLSRIGVVVAVLNIVLILIITRKTSYTKMISVFLLGIIIVIGYSYIKTFMEYSGQIGVVPYLQGARGLIMFDFFENMTKYEFFWGYPIGTVHYYLTTRDYNVFLRIWNYYTVIGFTLIIFFILFRFINFKKYYLPSILLIPFLFYGMIEELYFPSFWDFSIYLLLFAKKK